MICTPHEPAWKWLCRMCHHLQCIMLSKDSDYLKRALCARGTRQKIRTGSLRSLGQISLHWKRSWLCYGNHWMGSDTLLETRSLEDRLLYRPQLHVKILSRKEETICKHDPQMLLASLGQSSVKTDWDQLETRPVVRWSEILNIFFKLNRKPWCCVLQTDDERDHLSCQQCLFQMPASFMVWWTSCVYGMGNVHIWIYHLIYFLCSIATKMIFMAYGK